MGYNQTSFKRGNPGRPKGCKNKTTLLREHLGLSYKDVCQAPLDLIQQVQERMKYLPIKLQIKASCIFLNYFIGLPKIEKGRKRKY